MDITDVEQSKLADRVAQLESKLSLLANVNHSPNTIPTTSPTPPTVPYVPLFNKTQSGDVNQNSLPEQSRPVQDEANTKFWGMPPPDVVFGLINLYFAKCHNRPFAFFNEDNFRCNFRSGDLPSYLILAIVACTAAISRDPWFENRQLQAARAIEQTAWTEISTSVLPKETIISIAAVQTLGLLSLLDYGSGRYNSGTMKLRIAVTLAQTLRMTTEPSKHLPAVQQEERRCVLWSLYVIDRMSSTVLDRTSVLSDSECVLRLPEDEETFAKHYQNRMPNLMTAKGTSLPQDSYFAKLVLAASKLGSGTRISTRPKCHHSFPFWHPEGRYAQLKEHSKYVIDFCKADMLGPQSALNVLKFRQISDKEANGPALGHRLYTQVSYHLLCIYINHPFFVRQQLSLTDVPCPTEFLQQTLKECQEHAELLTRFVTIIQQFDLCSQMSIFPGFAAFASGIVHLLFMHSPDPALAERSRELYQKTLNVLLGSGIQDATSQHRSFLAVLDALERNPGVASILVDPNATEFCYPSISTSTWRLLDFSWLCQRLCIDPNLSSPLPTLPTEQQNKRRYSIATNMSEGTTTDTSSSTSISTPQAHSSGSPLSPDIEMSNTNTKSPARPLRQSLDCATRHAAQSLTIESSPYKSSTLKDNASRSPLINPRVNAEASFTTTNTLPPEGFQVWNDTTGFMTWVGISYNFPNDLSLGLTNEHANEYPQQYGNTQQGRTPENPIKKRRGSLDLY